MDLRLTWAIVLTAPLLASGSDSRALPDGYTRRVWQTQDGLPENTVQAFAQSAGNYLWIGTSGGLLRFDGERFAVFDHENTPAIREDSIFCLTVTRDGSLWAGTDGRGLLRYRNGVFRTYSARDGLSNDFIRSVYEDRAGTLWAGTDDGLFRFQGDRFLRIDGTAAIPRLAVHAVRQDRNGDLWVGGSTVLLIPAARGRESDTAREFHLEGLGSVARVKSILETGDGTVWVGTVSGLQRLPPAARPGGRFEVVPEITSTVRALLEDRDGSLWIGSIGAGIMRYANGRFTRVTAPDAPPSSTVLALFQDNEQNIWAGMQTGLLRLSRTAMNTFPLPEAANADFGTVYPDPDGSLWVASTHLYRINPRRDAAVLVPPPAPGVRVRNIYRDRSGAFWIGTEGDGVFREKDGARTQFTKRNGLVNDFIRAVMETRDGSIWIGTDEGLSRWHDGALSSYREPEGLAYFSVRTLLEDSRGDVWIGTERGVSRFSDGRFVQDDVTRQLRSQKVWAIHEDSHGGIWFGTRGSGLLRWRQGKLSSFSTPRGLASDSIYQILEDRAGTLWLSGPNGISAVAREDLDKAADDPAFRPAVTLFGLSDGVEATQIYGGVAPAGCLTSAGEVWFPSNRGPVRIIPPGADGAPHAESLPQVVIEQVVVDGRNVPLSGRLVVPPGDGRLEIDYSAVRLRSQERLRFRYMLEGFDHDWTDALRRRGAYYTNLPPGQYRFRVQAFEMNMPQSVTEAILPIHWRPHLYRTPWFAAVCGLTLLAAVLAVHRLRLRQVHARFQAVLGERSRIAREMHDTVIQGCAGVSALLEGIASIDAQEPPSRKELLDCARSQVRATVDEARRAVWNWRQNGATSPEIGLLLGQMAQEMGQTSHIPVEVESAGKPVPLDPEVEHDVLMVTREAVYNAVRHAQASQVRIHVQFDPDALSVKVVDNGRGFDPVQAISTPGEHFGLVGMRERTKRLGGLFEVRSTLGKGTQLEFRVPVRSPASLRLQSSQ